MTKKIKWKLRLHNGFDSWERIFRENISNTKYINS